MQLEVLEVSSWKRTFKIKVPPETLTSHIDRTLEEYRKKTKLPGFRPGKVPREILRARFGDRIEKEAVEVLVPEVFSAAVKDSGLTPLTDGVLDNIKVGQDKSVDLAISFEIVPPVSLRRYKGIPVTREVRKVASEDIEKRLEALRETAAEYVVSENPARDRDLLIIDYEVRSESGKRLKQVSSYSVRLGSGTVLPELEEALRGARAGDTREVQMTYPADDPRPELAGKMVKVSFTVKETKEKRLPPLDDTLALTLGKHQTLDELRRQVQTDLEKEEEQKADAAVQDKILKTVLEENPFEVPQAMVDRMLAAIARGRTIPPEEESKFRETFVPMATEQIRRNLVIEEIARLEHIECRDEDLQDRLSKIAEASGESPEAVRAVLERQGKLQSLKDEVRDRKVLDFLTREAEYPQKRRFGLWG